MTIQFMEPFRRAWARMTAALFKPFDIRKWFVVGFNAFLCGLMEVSNGSGGLRGHKDTDLGKFFAFPQTAWDWLQSHPAWAVAVLFAILVAVAVVVALTWVSSRGVFMFLDSVARDRVEIAGPWRDYRKEGDSLFVWRLVFGLIVFAALGGLVVWLFVRSAAAYEAGIERVFSVGLVAGAALLALALSLGVAYVVLFLRDFVAALMYKHRITAVAAWRMFLDLFGKYPMHFLGYGLVVLLLMVAFVAAVAFAVVATCCIGAIFLAIPYVGTVATLPFWYTLRAYSLEFLAQFGPQYDVFPRAEAGPAPAV